MRALLCVLLGALPFPCAHAHDLIIKREEVIGMGDSSTMFEIATARADIRRSDRGRPGAVFVAVTTQTGGMMGFTTGGWKKFSGGLLAPAAVFEKLPSSHSMVIFDGRNPKPMRLSGKTLCEAAAKLGATGFAMAVGYGVLTPDDEATIDRMISLGSKIDLRHMRLAFVHRNMQTKNKWSEVYRVNCNGGTVGLGDN